MIGCAGLPVVDFVNGSTIRLISTAYITEPALAPLVDSEEEQRILEEVEAMTSARQGSIVSVPAGVNPDELLNQTHGFGWSYVNAAFCYTRATGNRFNGPERGAWYAAYGRSAAKTAQAEVSWHLTRELSNVGVFENVTAYRELVAGFATRFHDLRDLRDQDFLAADIDIAYPAGQALARTITQHGGNGVLYPSVRHGSGQCLAAFRPHLVQNVRLGQTWHFEWQGTPRPAITKI